MKKLIVALLFVLLTISPASAEKASEGLFLDQNIQGSYNPLGLQLVTKLFYRIPLIRRSGILWESTKLEFGIQNNLSPAYDFAGAFVSIEPIALFNLTLSAQAAGYYTALGYGLYPLSGYGAGYNGAALDSVTAKNGTGIVLSAAPTIKAAVGPIAVLDTGSLSWFRANGGSGYFYEIAGDTVLAGSDIEIGNQAYLLATVATGLLVGLNDGVLYVPASGYVSHRLGAIGIYSAPLSKKLSIYGAIVGGTFLADRYYQYKLYVAGQAGVTLRL